jgi:hypothetical protein
MSTIITRNSATSGSIPSSLIQGELAINVTNDRLFFGSGSGNVVKEFGVSASYALTSSYASTALLAPLYLPLVGGTITGNVTVLGTASINTLIINQIGYSSGSNQLGDTAEDTQTLFGTVIIPTGSLTVTGSVTAHSFIGSFSGSITSPGSPTQIIFNDEGVLGATDNFVYSSSRVGIGTSSPITSLDVLGSGRFTNDLTITGSIIAPNITGSLLGTASYSAQALSASYAQTASYVENAQTASYVQTAQTASYVQQAISASYASTASYVQNAQTASYVQNAQTASYVENAQTASYVQNAQTASYVLQAISASYATTSSYVLNAQTASYVLQAISASYASTASYVQNAQTASYVQQAVSASYASTASYVQTAQTASYVQNAQTASYVLQAISASYALTSSYVENAQTSSYILNAISASYASTASYVQNAQTASYVQNAQTASYATQALSASWAPGGGGSGLKGIHVLTKPITNGYYNAMLGSGQGNIGWGSNFLYLSPFIPNYDLIITEMSIEVTTAASGNNIKVLIYSDENGTPKNKLIESPAFDTSTTGLKSYVTSYTFTAGTTYWVGHIGNSFSGTVRGLNQTIIIGSIPNSLSTPYNVFSFSTSFSSVPNTLSLNTSNLAGAAGVIKVNFKV